MTRFDASTLHAFIVATLQAGGSTPDEARLVADHLVRANLTGHDSHGIGMLPRYARHLAEGTLVNNRRAEVVRDAGAVLVVDGGRGYGQVIAKQALDLAIARARALGCCQLALRNAHHIGRIGHWAEQCAAAGMASLHMVNVVDHAPMVATYGANEARLGTNPFCAALPDPHGAPIVLDMATSKIAHGKARVARNQGVEVAPDCLYDAAGQPTRDPNVMFDDAGGALIAFGAHKGSGLAIMCELFASALTGGASIAPDNPRAGGIINNMLSVVIDPSATTTPATMAREAAALANYVHNARASADGPPRLPGEVERAHAEQRQRDGIPIDPATLAELRQAARGYGLAEAAIDAHLGPSAA